MGFLMRSRARHPRCVPRRLLRSAQGGQALVETALVIPLLLSLALGVVGVGRVVQAQMGVSAVAREAARSAALANSPRAAADAGLVRGRDVAAGYGLTNGSLELQVEPGALARGGLVRATARYEVALGDLPLMGWLRVPLSSSQAEPVDPYRSRWS